MGDNSIQALRRFCHVVSSVMLIVFLVCTALSFFVQAIPFWVIIIFLLVWILLLAIQDRISTRLEAYLPKTMRYSCVRIVIVSCLFLIVFKKYSGGTLREEDIIMLGMAMHAMSLLLDTLYALRSINRHADAATPDPERKPD